MMMMMMMVMVMMMMVMVMLMNQIHSTSSLCNIPHNMGGHYNKGSPTRYLRAKLPASQSHKHTTNTRRASFLLQQSHTMLYQRHDQHAKEGGLFLAERHDYL